MSPSPSLCLPPLHRSGAFRKNFVWHGKYLWQLWDFGRKNDNFIKLPGKHELKKTFPSLRGEKCLPSPVLKSSACKRWEFVGCLRRWWWPPPVSLPEDFSCQEPKDAQEDCPGASCKCFPLQQPWRFWIPLHSWTTRWADHRVFYAALQPCWSHRGKFCPSPSITGALASN